MSQSIAYFNGRYQPLNETKISVLDRGFLFGDAVYEVIPVYAGQCYRLDGHIKRLERSLEGIRLENPYSVAQWREILTELVAKNAGGDCSVYLQVSRGAEDKRAHALPENPKPTIVAFCQPWRATDPSIATTGIKAILRPDPRWQYNRIKSTALLANILASDEAKHQGAVEALLTRGECIIEGTSSNVFAVIDGVIITPALRDEILAGITRGTILELAGKHDMPAREAECLTIGQIRRAEEIWISSSTREIYPITQLDGQPVGQGLPGPTFKRMLELLSHDANL